MLKNWEAIHMDVNCEKINIKWNLKKKYVDLAYKKKRNVKYSVVISRWKNKK